MTTIDEEAVLNIVKAHFEVSGIRDDGSFTEYTGTLETFLSLARICYDWGYMGGMWDCQNTFINSKHLTNRNTESL